MSNHLGDTNKMVSETPRTDAAYARSTRAGVYELFKESQDIERELNAANAEIEEKRKDVVWLATEKAKLEEELMDTKNKHAVLVADVVLDEDRAEQIKRLRKANFQLREGAEEQKQRIKRLEKACGEMVSEEDTYIRLQTWLKAKEDKP